MALGGCGGSGQTQRMASGEDTSADVGRDVPLDSADAPVDAPGADSQLSDTQDVLIDACETACGCPDDRLEPNDTFELASPVTSGTEACLSLSHGDRDLFAIEVPAGGRLQAEVVFDPARREVGIGLRGPAGEFISASAGNILRIDRVLAEAGRYIVVVQLNVGDPVDYDVVFEVSAE